MLKFKPKKPTIAKEKKKPIDSKETEPFKNDDSSKDILQFYKNKLTFLETKIAKFQNEYKELKDSLTKSEADKNFISNQKNNIVAYLTKELEEKAQEILNLNMRISSCNFSNKYGQENLEKCLKEQENVYEGKIQMLNNNNMQLELKLSNVQNFIKEKAELEAKLNEHLKKIENLKEENQKNIYELEKSNLIEKKRLKSEMMEKLNDLAKEFRNAFHQQISETTKKIIRENYLLNSKIKKITETTNCLLNENEKLKEINERNKIEIGYMEKNEEHLAKKYTTSVKTIQMLMESVKINDEAKLVIESHQKEIEALKTENARVKLELKKTKKHDESLPTSTLQNCECEENLKRVKIIKEKLLKYSKYASTLVLNEFNNEKQLELMPKIAVLVNKLELI